MITLHLQSLQTAYDQLLALGDLTLAYMDTGYTPDDGADSYWSDISASRASGTSDEVLTGVTVRIDTANNRIEIDTDNPSQSPVTASTDKYTLRVDTGTDSTSPVLATIDINEGTLNPVSGTLSITINAEGHFGVNST